MHDIPEARRLCFEVRYGHPPYLTALDLIIINLLTNNLIRLLLLHDPGGFRFVPEDDGSLVLSGHTHGGQIGLLSLGLPLTTVGFVLPDHGLWAHGCNKLYVHRGQGCR